MHTRYQSERDDRRADGSSSTSVAASRGSALWRWYERHMYLRSYRVRILLHDSFLGMQLSPHSYKKASSRALCLVIVAQPRGIEASVPQASAQAVPAFTSPAHGKKSLHWRSLSVKRGLLKFPDFRHGQTNSHGNVTPKPIRQGHVPYERGSTPPGTPSTIHYVKVHAAACSTPKHPLEIRENAHRPNHGEHPGQSTAASGVHPYAGSNKIHRQRTRSERTPGSEVRARH